MNKYFDPEIEALENRRFSESVYHWNFGDLSKSQFDDEIDRMIEINKHCLVIDFDEEDE